MLSVFVSTCGSIVSTLFLSVATSDSIFVVLVSRFFILVLYEDTLDSSDVTLVVSGFTKSSTYNFVARSSFSIGSTAFNVPVVVLCAIVDAVFDVEYGNVVATPAELLPKRILFPVGLVYNDFIFKAISSIADWTFVVVSPEEPFT